MAMSMPAAWWWCSDGCIAAAAATAGEILHGGGDPVGLGEEIADQHHLVEAGRVCPGRQILRKAGFVGHEGLGQTLDDAPPS